MGSLNFDNIQTKGLPGFKFGGTSQIGNIIGEILPYIFGAAAIALLIYLIIGGFQIMTSRGDPKAAQAAQLKITNAIIGFVIVIFSYTIVQLFGQVFGLKGTLFSQIFGGS